MRETLLVIDGRGQPEALLRSLERAGFFCVYARGPLKAKALLNTHPVALIVWKDNTGNAELSRDLARVWKAHPHVPVIHLYAWEPLSSEPRSEPFSPGGSAVSASRERSAGALRPSSTLPESAQLDSPVRISLAAEAADAQLLPLIEQTLARLKPPPPSELEVLGAASRHRAAPGALAAFPGMELTSHTGLSVEERASLFGRAGQAGGRRWARGWRWIRHVLSRIRPQGESGGV